MRMESEQQYFTLSYLIRADSEDSPRTVRAVREQSEDSLRTVRAESEHYYSNIIFYSARTLLGLCLDSAKTLLGQTARTYLYSDAIYHPNAFFEWSLNMSFI